MRRTTLNRIKGVRWTGRRLNRMHPVRRRREAGVFYFRFPRNNAESAGESWGMGPSYLNCKMAEHGAKVEIMAAVFSDGEYKWRYYCWETSEE